MRSRLPEAGSNRRPPSSASDFCFVSKRQTILPSSSTARGHSSCHFAGQPAGPHVGRLDHVVVDRDHRGREVRRSRSTGRSCCSSGCVREGRGTRPRWWYGSSPSTSGDERLAVVQAVEDVAGMLGEERRVGPDHDRARRRRGRSATAARRARRSASRTTATAPRRTATARASPRAASASQNDSIRGRCSGSVPPPWLAQRRRPGLRSTNAVREHGGDARPDLGREVDRRRHRRIGDAVPVRRVERVHEHAQTRRRRRPGRRAGTCVAPVTAPRTFEPISTPAGRGRAPRRARRWPRRRPGAARCPGPRVGRARAAAIVATASFSAAAEAAPEVGLRPVAEQLGHHRDRLHRDPAVVHRRDAGVHVPRLARHGAEHARRPTSTSAVSPCCHERREPIVVTERQTLRHHVGVDVDDR